MVEMENEFGAGCVREFYQCRVILGLDCGTAIGGAESFGRRRSSGVQGRRVGEEDGGEGELGPKNNYMIL